MFTFPFSCVFVYVFPSLAKKKPPRPVSSWRHSVPVCLDSFFIYKSEKRRVAVARLELETKKNVNILEMNKVICNLIIIYIYFGGFAYEENCKIIFFSPRSDDNFWDAAHE